MDTFSESQVLKQLKRIPEEVWWAVEIVLGALFVWFFGDWLFPEPIQAVGDGRIVWLFDEKTKVAFQVALTFTFTVINVLGGKYVREYRLHRRAVEHLQVAVDRINSRLAQTIESSAFYSDNSVLERNAVELLRRKEHGPLWIVAKFVSKQLSNAFQTLRLEISGAEYSEFASRLYPECARSICLTSSFTPAEWMRQLYPEKNDQLISRLEAGDPLPEVCRSLNLPYPPRHMAALIAATSPKKKRLIVLEDGHWESLIAQEALLRAFLAIDPALDNRFCRRSELTDTFDFLRDPQLDLARYDYAIFDDELLLKWERPLRGGEAKPLLLLDLERSSPEYRRFAAEVFAFDQGQYQTQDEVLKYITKGRQTIASRVDSTLDLPHKWSYFCAGASAWAEISKSDAYELGKNELRTLQRLLAAPAVADRLRGSWSVIHIGAGVGVEISVLATALDRRALSYLVVDISPELAQLSAQEARSCGIDSTYAVRDVIEVNWEPLLAPFRAGVAPRSLFCILANGAILSNEPVLQRLAAAMRKGDALLITVETYAQEREPNMRMHFRQQAVLDLFAESLRVVGVSDAAHDEYFTAKFENCSQNGVSTRNIEVSFDCMRWRDHLPSRNDALNGKLPAKFTVFRSLRPQLAELDALVASYGLTVVHGFNSAPEGCCGLLAVKE